MANFIWEDSSTWPFDGVDHVFLGSALAIVGSLTDPNWPDDLQVSCSSGFTIGSPKLSMAIHEVHKLLASGRLMAATQERGTWKTISPAEWISRDSRRWLVGGAFCDERSVKLDRESDPIFIERESLQQIGWQDPSVTQPVSPSPMLSPEKATRGGGRKASYDYEAMMIEMARVCFIAEVEPEFEPLDQYIRQWFATHHSQGGPDPRGYQEKIERFVEALRTKDRQVVPNAPRKPTGKLAQN